VADGEEVSDYPFQLDPPLSGAPAFGALLARMHQVHRTHQVAARPENATLRLAVQYCRAFFDADPRQADLIEDQLHAMQAEAAGAIVLTDADLIQDLSEADDATSAASVDEDAAADEGEEAEPDYEVTAPSAARDHVRALLLSGCDNLLDIAQRILLYLTEHAAAAEAGADTLSTDAESNPAHEEDNEFWPDSEHCHCLTQMLTELNIPDPSMDGMDHTPVPTWADVSAAKVYQDLLYAAVRSLHPLPLSAVSAAQVYIYIYFPHLS
jgi:hypothetical protein